MSQKLSINYLFFVITFICSGCGSTESTDTKNISPASSVALHAGDEKYFRIDTKQSEIVWIGSGFHGKHDGYAYISKGELVIDNGQLTGGIVEMDMNKTEGPGHDKDNNLINNLKGPDFFDVKQFPFSKMTILKSESISGQKINVTGNLTIRNITHPVSFPAGLSLNSGTLNARGRLVIDRTQWDIKYRSGKFFDNLKDQAISDSIEFNIKIVAKK